MTDTRELVERCMTAELYTAGGELSDLPEACADALTALSERVRVLEEALMPFAAEAERTA